MMREIKASRWIGILAAEELACFVELCLPTLLARQAHDHYLQLETLLLIGALQERLDTCGRRPRYDDHSEVAEISERLAQHIAAAVAGLPREQQLEYREILRLYELARQTPATGWGSPR